jgi:hypothetical protein
MTVQQLKDALQVALDGGVSPDAPVRVYNIDHIPDEIRDVTSDSSDVSIWLEDYP